jgi:monoamine oxidase
MSGGELVDRFGEDAEKNLTRRGFLMAGAGLAAGLGLQNNALGANQPIYREKSPSLKGRTSIPFAIIGGGLAGLLAAYRLMHGMKDPHKAINQKSFVIPHVFEASSRWGGRMYTFYQMRGQYPKILKAREQFAEAGGEYLDSDNPFSIFTCTQFRVPMTRIASYPHIIGTVYWSDGPRTAAEVALAFKGFAREIESDVKFLRKEKENPDSERLVPTHDRPLCAEVEELDKLSLEAYLLKVQERFSPRVGEMLEIPDWLIALVLNAYIVEFGNEKQSALNLLTLIGLRSDDDINMFGPSDYSIRLTCGSQSLIDTLVSHLPPDALHLGAPLLEVTRDRDSGYYILRFGGTMRTVLAQNVIFALPLTILDQVLNLSGTGIHTTEIPLTELERECIANWPYGNPGKLLIPMGQRFWCSRLAPGDAIRASSGNMLTTLGTQSMWETTETQTTDPNGPGILTCMMAGTRASLPSDEIANSAFKGLNTLYPGETDQAGRFIQYPATNFIDSDAKWIYWKNRSYQKGGYTCPGPGDYKKYFGVLSKVGSEGIYFCGEHTSVDFQGFMEGAAESGTYVALKIRGELAEFHKMKNAGRVVDLNGVRT